METLLKAFVRVMGDILGNLSSGWFALLLIEPSGQEIRIEILITRLISGIITLGAAVVFRFTEA